MGLPQPMRVVVNASKKGQYWALAWDSPEEVISIAIRLIEGKFISLDPKNPPNPQFLVKERWTSRTFVVFDLFNSAYDPDTAHVDENDISVVQVSLSEKETTDEATAGVRKVINNKIREIHNDTGRGSRPPFSVDHAEGKVPRYYNPRIPIRGSS
ncbi:hypothetical protein HIM_09045 [Hirsutella minnesotensis 3608]|uniref:Uncharacterized protein n=1 Tax=Hirsutella minnesotensis 3608 TaxID=1043627 RepID=A0A0F7ZGW0_9HYPO|nr:hypothetical protein HIM_09045 [Hirsutella minnesotensis 3608]